MHLPEYPPDSAEDLIDWLQERIVGVTRNRLNGQESGALHNHFAIARQTLAEMDFQHRRMDRVFSILRRKEDLGG